MKNLFDSRAVRRIRKILPQLFLSVWILVGTGCTGINASHSVSPASFFLPGLIQVEPTEPASPTDPDVKPVLVAVHLPQDLPIE